MILNCIDVVKEIIIKLDLQLAQFTLFEHFVAINWRGRYFTVSQKKENLKASLVQHTPFQEWNLLGKNILDDKFDPSIYVHEEHRVISLSSKIRLPNGQIKHLAMMNLHPEEELSLDNIINIVQEVTQYLPGYLLESGRYYHYYGFALLFENEWINFMAQFLMPTIIVSPRYIGHCLYRKYAALRLSTDTKYKTVLPYVCKKIGHF